jgi:hypothetical protein
MAQKSVIEEAIDGLQKAKKELDTVVSWMFTHPETWTSDLVDDFKERVQEIKEDIDALVEDVRESGEGEGD